MSDMPDGPWDADALPAAERGVARVDVGGLLIGGADGFAVGVQGRRTPPDTARVTGPGGGTVLLSARWLPSGTRAWDAERAELAAGYAAQAGESMWTTHDRFGIELHAEGLTGSGPEPMRVTAIGVDGPGWLLRADLWYPASAAPDTINALRRVVADTVVVNRVDGHGAPRQIPLYDGLPDDDPRQAADPLDDPGFVPPGPFDAAAVPADTRELPRLDFGGLRVARMPGAVYLIDDPGDGTTGVTVGFPSAALTLNAWAKPAGARVWSAQRTGLRAGLEAEGWETWEDYRPFGVPSVVARPTAHLTAQETLDEMTGPATTMRVTGFDVHGWFLCATMICDSAAPDFDRQMRDLEDIVFSTIVSRPADPVPDLRPIAVSAERLPPGWDA